MEVRKAAMREAKVGCASNGKSSGKWQWKTEMAERAAAAAGR